MNIRRSFLAVVLPMILLQLTSEAWGQDLVGCGVYKGCFQQPPDCMADSCQAYVTWETLEDGQSRFSLRATAAGWVAVGLRPADATGNGMVPADVYACTKNKEVRRSRNDGTSGLNSLTNPPPQDTVTTESAEFSDGVIKCTFTRQPSLEGDTSFYNISGDNQYFILLAVGDNVGSDGTIQDNRHSSRWSTSKPQGFQNFTLTMSSGEALAKTHACLMVIAWVGFASIGIIMARFFKPMWPNSKLCGTKVWFTIHRMCMVTCVLCFCTAFVIIFVHVKGFVDIEDEVTVAHAICGIIVTCLGIINPIMAIFRPHPGTPNRPIFNWLHWGVGTAALVLALVTVLLGIGYKSNGALKGIPSYVFFVMIVFIGFLILIWILFEVQLCMTESRGRSNDMALKTTGGSTDQLAADADSDPPSDDLMPEGLCISQVTEEGATAKTILLCIYIVGVVIVVAFLVISIALIP